MWSHPNLYTDEGRRAGKGTGKELADLVVVFGDHVLIFSDKHCAFPKHPDLNVSWRRWYSSAVEKSARQLLGAKRWLERFPNRIYRDAGCMERFPVSLPSPGVAKIHLIAVTRGSYEACREHFGGGSTGSLMVVTSLRGTEAHTSPFCVGHVLADGPFVHVLDEMTVEILLSEFDTATDFTTYLVRREKFLSTEGKYVIAHGEEDLVVAYSVRIDKNGEHSFPEASPKYAAVVVKEGAWEEYRRDARYKAKKSADLQSYAWDRLIELMIATGESEDGASSEPYLRTMAAEPRLSRRVLAEQMSRAFNRELRPMQRFVITTVSPKPPRVVYLFIALPAPFGCGTYDEYRQLRRDHVFACCQMAKLRFPPATKIVGIAREPMAWVDGTFEIMFIEGDDQPMSSEVARVVEDMQIELGITDSSVDRMHVLPLHEFPAPEGARARMSPASRLLERQRLRDLVRIKVRKKLTD